MANKSILLVAAENDAFPGAKVGGVGDVIRDLPGALAQQGAGVATVIPSYGFLARATALEKLADLPVGFAKSEHSVEVFKHTASDCDHYIFHHSMFFCQGETVYVDDEEGRAFASDATKFAFFSACVAQAILQGVLPQPDVIHCHDWHAAFLLILLKYDPAYVGLTHIHTAYTIHNLALQGVRPFHGDPSSLESWFPELSYTPEDLRDPRYHDCLNPTRAAILLADRVHTVSPSYASEILAPSDHSSGSYGGEGLEKDLRRRSAQGELFGIINGCEYPEGFLPRRLSRTELAQCMIKSLSRWAVNTRVLASAHWLAEKRIAGWSRRKSENLLLTSIGRLTEQKVRLFYTTLPSGETALQAILSRLGDDGALVLLGSGDPNIEKFLAKVSADNANFVFLNGYSDEMSRALYDSGDIFLMPSSYEPCGTSQMLAMRSGQPCLVNAVGGLRDTVTPRESGFVFEGQNDREQAQAMLRALDEAMALRRHSPKQWQEIVNAAMASRFTWRHTAESYMEQLY